MKRATSIGILARIAVLIGICAFCNCAIAQTLPQPYYQITNLGVLPNRTFSYAVAINNNGVVVGRSGTFDANGDEEQRHAFVYQNCRMTDLGTLGGNESAAQAISRWGTIVGWADRSDGTMRGFSYSAGIMSDLGGNPKLQQNGTGISSWDIPVGVESVPGVGAGQGVFYYGITAYQLPGFLVNPPSGLALVQNITGENDLLQVIGAFSDAGGNQVGLVSSPAFGLTAPAVPDSGGSPGAGSWTVIQSIPGYPGVLPFAINFNGHIVGAASPNGLSRAFLSTDPNSPAQDLGTIGGQGQFSAAEGINIHDSVVGFAEYQAQGGLHAFLYNGSTMIDLNTRLINGTGWELIEAQAINDNGQIVGWGFYNGQRRAFLLSPVLPIFRFLPPVVPPCGRENA